MPALSTTTLPVATATAQGAASAAADAAVWRLQVLGRFELDDGQTRLTRLRSRAAMALLARLAMAPGREHAREELASLLWPDADADSGRSRLRQTLSLLKAVLEPAGQPQVILADRRALRLAPSVLWCDAPAFEQALRAGDAPRADALYRGELLPGFYDEWVVDERTRLQALADRLPPVAARGAAPAAPRARPIAADAHRSGPPAAAAPAPGLRLPQYLTRLIGADVSGGRLRALVSEQRLVMLLGAGGTGKSRLAVEVARVLCAADAGAAPRFDGAVFVSLVGAVNRTETLDRLAGALRVAGGSDVVEAILQVLDRRPLLVLLDNAEQLDDEAAAAIAHLAERLPAAHWLVTSRRPLGLDGERSFMLDGLPLPARDAPLAEVVINPAVALFIDRARAHRPDFHVGASQRTAVVDLVGWLEGLPLAIELAAAQARTLGPAELLALLQQARAQRQGAGLALLARRGARSGSDPRQASMRDVVAWSWQLLAPASRALLLAISVLPAGVALDVAASL
ncbi:MAG: ATP-binding protein, partial [Aquabacterium sp.]